LGVTETAPTVRGYDVEARVGPDPDGHVFRARELATDRIVALRRLTPAEGAALAGRLDRLASLEEEHVVPVLGLVEESGATYLVTEWVTGATLAEILAAGNRMIVGQMLGVARGVLQGLAHAHQHGVVHGRIGPSHVLVDSDGRARLVDFGAGPPVPSYLAPEAVRHPGGELTRTADVYAVAAVVVHLLTGQPAGDQKRNLRSVDAALRPVLAKALSHAPTDRHQDAGELLAAITKAAKRAYGKTWATEAGVSAIVAPLVPPLVPLEAPAPPAKEQKRVKPDRPRRGLLKPLLIGGAAVAVLAGGAVAAFLVLDEDPAPERPSLRTDQFCADFDDDASAIAGTGAQSRFDSSGARGTPDGDAAARRASVSCWWGGGESGTVVSMTVGAASDVEASDVDSASRSAAIFDGVNQKTVKAAGLTWRPRYATRCEDVDRQGYDAAYACNEPVIAIPKKPADPGSVRVVLVTTVGDQALVCGTNRSVTTTIDEASYDGLVEGTEDLCAVVLAEVRRGG
jgi:hypothetical protein